MKPLDTLLDIAESFVVKFTKLFELINFFSDFDFVERLVAASRLAFFNRSIAQLPHLTQDTALLNATRKPPN